MRAKRNRLAEPAAERRVPITELEPDPDNIRLTYEGEIVDQLSRAVAEDGAFLQPPRVYRTPDGKLRSLNGNTRVVSALKAHGQGALQELTVVETSPPKDRAEKVFIQLAENEIRAQLGPVDRGRAFKMLREEGLSYREILAECERRGIIPPGRTKGWVSQLISLTELEPEVQRMANRGQFSVNHGLLLRKLPPGRQLPLARRIVEEDLSLAAFEALVEAELGGPRQESLEFLYRDLDRALEDRAEALLGGRRRRSRQRSDRNGKIETSWTLIPKGELALAQEAMEAGHSKEEAAALAAQAVEQACSTSEAVRQLLVALARAERSDLAAEAGGPAMAEYVRIRLRRALQRLEA